MKNKEIRNQIKESGVPFWRVADEIGVTDMTLYRWLRSERDTSNQPRILDALEQLVKEREEVKNNAK